MHGQMPRTYRKGMVGAVIAVRTDSTGRVRNWGWCRVCTDKDSQPPRIVAEAQYQRLTGRLAANGKRRETDLHIAPVRVGSWADETRRSVISDRSADGCTDADAKEGPKK
jgi:hypothetical protein